MTGAPFALYLYKADRDSNGLPDTIADSESVKKLVMTGSPSIASGSLEPGVYCLRDTEAPDGYKAAADSLVRVNNDGTVEFATWTAGTAVENVT